MPKSTTFLPDVNVWLALASRRHLHADVCAAWVSSIGSAELSFCRITQMGLLRLLTTESVMKDDVLSSRKAWVFYQSIFTDERVVFAHEPLAVEHSWQRLTRFDKATPKLWTDAYLIAFARSAGMRLVTLDQGLSSRAGDALLLQGWTH